VNPSHFEKAPLGKYCIFSSLFQILQLLALPTISQEFWFTMFTKVQENGTLYTNSYAHLGSRFSTTTHCLANDFFMLELNVSHSGRIVKSTVEA
jgi:hypothetical protein